MNELMKRLWNDPASVRKFILALIAAVLIAVAHGVLPGVWEAYAAIGLAFINALGVYAIRNDHE